MEGPLQSWGGWGSFLATAMFIVTMARDYFPYSIRSFVMKLWIRILDIVYPYGQVRIDEHSGEWLKHAKAYSYVDSYLTANASSKARRLKAEMNKDSSNLVLTMDEHEEVSDEYRGVAVKWGSHKIASKQQNFSFYPSQDDRRFYTLTFHKRHRDLILNSYLNHVIEDAKIVEFQKRKRKLFTNTPTTESYTYKKKVWSHVEFEHPATFQTLAMEPEEKREILDDLDFFKTSEEYYAKIGKPWKRGYLLYGPPGTGKSTMIAAMANYMDYDVYDLELTSVKTNTDLRKLFIETTSKSIIVIEDIDCSLQFSAKRSKEKKKDAAGDDEKDEVEKKKKETMDSNKEDSKVTLSGILNFIDGLWSACGGERLIVFTTNHVEKLDPALIRTGRMDKHIEMSYCRFAAFKVLAKNYLDLDDHPLFDKVKELLEVERVDVAPADVAERLMPRTLRDKELKTPCLEVLIEFICKTKVDKNKKGRDDDDDAEEVTEEEEQESNGVGSEVGSSKEDDHDNHKK